MIPRLIIALAGAAALLGGCAAAPRTPAANLATAGLKATSSFGQEVQNVEEQLRYADVNEAFARTWSVCSLSPICEASTSPQENADERNQLADLVALRARAIRSLGTAYAALQTEAAYDNAADMQGAGKEAVDAANAFAKSAAELRGRTPGAAPISGTVASLVDFGFGILGEQLQRKRILAANREISKAVLQLRNGMQDESVVFDTLADYIVGKRTAAKLALYQSGLTTGTPLIAPIATNLGMPLVSNSESLIAGSKPLRTTIEATIAASARVDVLAAQGRYRAGISALDALLRQHAALDKQQAVSLADVERLLQRLDASLDTQDD